MRPSPALERRVREVDVARHVVGLVLEPELRGVELLRHAGRRKARNGLVPAREDVVVVEAEAVAPRRAVRRGADDLDPIAAEPLERFTERGACVTPVDALDRHQVVVEADLVAELLEAPEPRDQVGVVPVGRRVEDEVGRPEPSLVLEPRQLERAVEARVDVVPERKVAGAARELAHRHDVAVAEAVEEARVLGVGEASLRPGEEQAARERLLHASDPSRFPNPRLRS